MFYYLYEDFIKGSYISAGLYKDWDHVRKWGRGRSIPGINDSLAGVTYKSVVYSVNGRTPVSRVKGVWSIKKGKLEYLGRG